MTQTISTIVDGLTESEEKEVYMTQTISTIVDYLSSPEIIVGLYDPNNFYYCRFGACFRGGCRLYDPNNFYYCRLGTNFYARIMSI